MKILIIKLNKIGDVLLISPLFSNLKAHYGEECIIDILVNDGTQGAISREHLRKIHCLRRPKNHLAKTTSRNLLTLCCQARKI